MTNVKYVVVTALDQTVGFWSETPDHSGCPQLGGWVLKHSLATLFDSPREAEQFVKGYMAGQPLTRPDGSVFTADDIENITPWVEEVLDVEEFRSREDTW